MLPIYTKNDLSFSPSFFTLLRLGEEGLKEVQDLEVFNDYGSVKFIGFTDVTQVNFDRDIKIDE